MIRRIDFRPHAEAEAVETRDWYEGRRHGLGAEFRAALEETVDRIVSNPFMYPRVHGENAASHFGTVSLRRVLPCGRGGHSGIGGPRPPEPAPLAIATIAVGQVYAPADGASFMTCGGRERRPRSPSRYRQRIE